MQPPHSCRCGARWGGYRTCHCAGDCHVTFSSPTAFDQHRRRNKCLTPADAGLVLMGREYECYGFPGKDEDADD